MRAMKRFLPIVLLLTAVRWTNAKIGDPPAEFEKRYGVAIKQAVDKNGTGIRIYRSEKFKEIRVNFVKKISQREEYKYLGGPPKANAAILESIRAENPGRRVSDRSDSLRVYSEEALAAEDRLSQPDGLEHTYSGTVKIKSEGDAGWAVLHDHDNVIEIAVLPPTYPREFELTEGASYSVTVLDEFSVDINKKVVVVSKREHVDWEDCTDDAGVGGIQQLVRIKQGDKTVFDRSICGLHHVTMELRSVEIAYGMYAPQSDAEIYCMKHFPHFRDFALGGCLVGDEKFTSIYICPKCVAECNEYTRLHPKNGTSK
jgi:hypothetical protein